MKLNPCRECGGEIRIRNGWLGYGWCCTKCAAVESVKSNTQQDAIEHANECNPLEAQDEIDSVS